VNLGVSIAFVIIVGKWALRGNDYAVISCRMSAPLWKEFQLADGSHLIFGNPWSQKRTHKDQRSAGPAKL